MTLRHAVCLAMLGAALLTLEVRAAGAMGNCAISAEACKYGSNGTLWFVPNGPAPGPRAVSLTTGGGRASSGEHGWGCGATDGAMAKGRSWGFSNRAAALYRALSECSRRTARSCHVISCSASVHSQAEVPLAWFNR